MAPLYDLAWDRQACQWSRLRRLPRTLSRKPTRGTTMDHAATARRLYDLINAGDIGGCGGHLADDFVEHEVTPGLAPTKAGAQDFFRMQRAAFPDLHMAVEDVFASGAKA